jgi:prevent-host-death family protein
LNPSGTPETFMSKPFNIYEAKTHLSKLVDRAAAGESIIIAKAGRPVARLVPLEAPVRRVPGRLKGRIWIAPDFDAPLPDDIQRYFEGEGDE